MSLLAARSSTSMQPDSFYTEADRLDDWRETQLLDLGFAPQEARYMVERMPSWWSWHQAEKLILAGWTPAQVIEVLT